MLKEAYKQKWRITKSGGGHLKAYSPCGKFMTTISDSPSSNKAFWDTRKFFRDAGLDV